MHYYFSSRKHTYIILTPFNSTLYSKTGVYRGIHYFFLFLLKNIDCGYSLDCLGEAVLTSTYNVSCEWKYEKYQNFDLKIFIFYGKILVCLNRRVFIHPR